MRERLERSTRLMTEGSIVRALFTIAWPIVFANTLHTAYQLIDTFWVGRLGAVAVAAVSVCYPLIFLFLGVGFGLSIAGSVFVSQFAGARRHDRVNHIAAQILLVMILVALALSALGIAVAGPVLHLIGVKGSVFDNARAYLRISYLGLVLSYGFIIFQSLLRGVGEVRFPLYVISTTVLLNAGLDPLFIFGWGPLPGAGVAGAAYATVVTQALAAFVGIAVLFSGRYGIHLRPRDFIPDLPLIRRAVMVGLPASLEQSNRTLGTLMLTFLATGFGTIGLATLGLGMRILSFMFIPALGLAMATATIVGQNIGAGNLRRAGEVARLSGWVAFWSLNFVALLFFAFAPHIVRFFVPGDEALIASGAEFVHIVSLSFGIIAAQQVLLGAFRAAGGTTTAMVFSMVAMWALQFPISWFLCLHTTLGVTGIWWGFPIGNAIAAALVLAWFRRGTWLQKGLIGKAGPVRERLQLQVLEEAAGDDEYLS